MSEFGGLWKHEKTQHALYNQLGLGSTTLLPLPFLGESDPKFPLGQQSVQKNTTSIFNVRQTAPCQNNLICVPVSIFVPPIRFHVSAPGRLFRKRYPMCDWNPFQGTGFTQLLICVFTEWKQSYQQCFFCCCWAAWNRMSQFSCELMDLFDSGYFGIWEGKRWNKEAANRRVRTDTTTLFLNVLSNQSRTNQEERK